jgi:hypothetical protein
MKRYLPLLFVLLLISALSGFLMSQPSLVGRIGINLTYRQYKFLETWWKGALLVFSVLLVLAVLQGFLEHKLGARKARWVHVLMIVLALVGFYFTWYDFHHTTTHRWLRKRFHIGAYLFWVGWIWISVYYLFVKTKSTTHEKEFRHPGLEENQPIP